jgi:hypothetical protein
MVTRWRAKRLRGLAYIMSGDRQLQLGSPDQKLGGLTMPRQPSAQTTYRERFGELKTGSHEWLARERK